MGSFLNVLNYYSHPQIGTEEEQILHWNVCLYQGSHVTAESQQGCFMAALAGIIGIDCYLTKAHLIG